MIRKYIGKWLVTYHRLADSIISMLRRLALQLPQAARLPAVFGIGYIIAILIFAILYWVSGLTVGSDNSELRAANILDCIYFSVVTITTLGYGDISPVGFFQKFFVVLETLIGVFAFGLFLTAIGYELSNRQSQIERQSVETKREQYLAGFYRRVTQRISNFLKGYHLRHEAQDPYQTYMFKDMHCLQVEFFKFEIDQYHRKMTNFSSNNPRWSPVASFRVLENSVNDLGNGIQEELDRYRNLMDEVEEIRRTEELIDYLHQIPFSIGFRGTWKTANKSNLRTDPDWLGFTSTLTPIFTDLVKTRNHYLRHAILIDDVSRQSEPESTSTNTSTWRSWFRDYLGL